MSGPQPLGVEALAGRLLDARLHLLDRQVLDCDQVPVTVVDDVALSDVPEGPLPDGTPPPTITDLLSGPVKLTRIFGGRPPASVWERIAWRHVSRLGIALELGVAESALDTAWRERWVAQHVIGRIPGAGHDPE